MLTAAIGSRAPPGTVSLERVRAGGAHDGVVVAHRVGAIGGQEMTRVLVALVEDRGSEPGLDRAEELPQIVVANQFRFEVHGESLARGSRGPGCFGSVEPRR